MAVLVSTDPSTVAELSACGGKWLTETATGALATSIMLIRHLQRVAALGGVFVPLLQVLLLWV